MKGFLKIAGLLGVFGGLFLLERRWPLRPEKESKARRNGRNLAIATLGGMTVHLAESPLLYPLAKKVGSKRWGLLKWLRLPKIIETAIALLLLDYTLYLQHVLHHRVPLFWRFHALHHVDLALDASTALRFHFCEIPLSFPPRPIQIFFISVYPLSLLIFHTCSMFSLS